VSLPLAEQAADRYRAHVREAAVDGAAAGLRLIFPPEILDDAQLQVCAEVAVDGAWPAFLDQADLFAQGHRLVERLYRALDAARWEVERLSLGQAAERAIHQANGRGGQ
jgi:hypothetical protein